MRPAVVLFSYVYRNICCFSECYILSIIIGKSALKLKRGFFMLKSICIDWFFDLYYYLASMYALTRFEKGIERIKLIHIDS